MYAWTIVALRVPIVLAWITALIAALVLLPPLGGSSSAPLEDIVPADAKALVAQQRALQLFGSTVSSDTIVVDHDPKGLTAPLVEAHVRQARVAARGDGPRGVRMALPIVNAPVAGLRWGEQNTAVLTYLFLDPELNLLERERLAHQYAGASPPCWRGRASGDHRRGPRSPRTVPGDRPRPSLDRDRDRPRHLHHRCAVLPVTRCAACDARRGRTGLCDRHPRARRDGRAHRSFGAKRDRAGAGRVAAGRRHRLHGVLHVGDAAASATAASRVSRRRARRLLGSRRWCSPRDS